MTDPAPTWTEADEAHLAELQARFTELYERVLRPGLTEAEREETRQVANEAIGLIDRKKAYEASGRLRRNQAETLRQAERQRELYYRDL